MSEDFLYSQLIKLGDMISDGLHYEPDGRWITKEYKKISKALGILPKAKKNTTQIDKFMVNAIEKQSCLKCNGKLKQTRRGSLRATCHECGAKFQLGKRILKKGE